MNETLLNEFLHCFLQINTEAVSQLKNAGTANEENEDSNHDHHDHKRNLNDSMDINWHKLLLAKATAMIVLFCASLLCGSLPFLLNRFYKWTERQSNTLPRSAVIIECLLYFGGGVLLATTFLHLLPEVQELTNRLEDCKQLPVLTFPLAELLMCSGFFLMYFIEEAIHTYLYHSQKLSNATGIAFERGHSLRNSHLVKKPLANIVELPSTLSVQDLLQHDSNKTEQQHIQRQYHGHLQHTGHNHNHLVNTDARSSTQLNSQLRGLFIVLALSLHELFEGIAIGLERSASSVLFMFGAVSAHKLVLAFCVGVELIVARTRLALAIVYVATFAIVSPLGIGLGMLISHAQATTGPSLISAILQGLASGTLLYVVFFEILSKNRAGLKVYLALFVGFLVMFGLQQLGAINGHGHSHGGNCVPSSPHEHHIHSTDVEMLSQHNGSSHTNTQHSNVYGAELIVPNKDYEQQLKVLRQLTQKLLANQTDY